MGGGPQFISIASVAANAAPSINHFCLGVENFNLELVTRELRERGANPENNLDAGFHIKDPEGISVQLVGA